jgi:hypothetical protein
MCGTLPVLLQALDTLLQAPLMGPNWLLSKGFLGVPAAARNWERLAQALATQSNITVATFGGSVTQGHLRESRNGSWVEEVQSWLGEAFPGMTLSGTAPFIMESTVIFFICTVSRHKQTQEPAGTMLCYQVQVVAAAADDVKPCTCTSLYSAIDHLRLLTRSRSWGISSRSSVCDRR